ncbi:hypothetical protein BURPS406E_D0640 [Burkholderia pseudomallei 406e]|uniref:Uncharacterized protein n=1 Tax=Burkholderia pseudomallei 1710a TaxID=320371 RepID=A0A0E1VR25_BURPE|nr:hypothetical protein BURPS406E_D0640 [Burkholderia pseudomallei 406e]EEC34397.1 conserved hypothetical protein [Burkholderia pseudomallei 576]EEP52228.1 conserved hypothetical protein [Burkholderia pseudomallei MSHR346]EET03298.1 hypothetical protein BURPS1710A_A1620 [Burkholderia pseudomallei 1710a]
MCDTCDTYDTCERSDIRQTACAGRTAPSAIDGRHAVVAGPA